jgi:hypothetical protein
MTASDYLTMEEAEAILPQVHPLLETARQLKREVELIAAGCNYNTLMLEDQRPRIAQLIAQLSEKLEQLEDLGCYVKDLDIGIVDFLSTFEGRDIFLCWRLGERTIKHWHEIDEGFAQRQEIIDLGQLTLPIEFETPFVENEN